MEQFKSFIERLLGSHPDYPKEAITTILKNKAIFPPSQTGEQLEFWDLPIRSFFLETDPHVAKSTVFLLDLIYEIVQVVLNDSLSMIRHHDSRTPERDERMLMIQAETGLMLIIKGKGKFAALPEYRSLPTPAQPDQMVAILRLHRLRRLSQTQPTVTHYFKLILAKRAGSMESEEEV